MNDNSSSKAKYEKNKNRAKTIFGTQDKIQEHVYKATKSNSRPSKPKHVQRCCIHFTWNGRGGSEVLSYVFQRPLTEKEMVMFKSSILIFNLMRDGHKQVLRDMSARVSFLENLRGSYGTASTTYGYIAHIYMTYLINKINFHKKFFEIDGTFTLDKFVDNILPEWSTKKLLKLVDALLKMQTSLLELGKKIFTDKNYDEVKFASLIPCIRETYDIYNMMTLLLHHLAANCDDRNRMKNLTKRYYGLYPSNKTFYDLAKANFYIKSHMTIPTLPDEAPQFDIAKAKKSKDKDDVEETVEMATNDLFTSTFEILDSSMNRDAQPIRVPVQEQNPNPFFGGSPFDNANSNPFAVGQPENVEYNPFGAGSDMAHDIFSDLLNAANNMEMEAPPSDADKIAQLEGNIQELRDELSLMQNNSRDANHQIDELNAENNALKTRVGTLEEENARLRRMLEQRDDEIARLKNENQRLRDELNAKNSELDAKNSASKDSFNPFEEHQDLSANVSMENSTHVEIQSNISMENSSAMQINFKSATRIVIDNGSGMVKAGIAGEEKPRTVFHSIVGRPKHQSVMQGMGTKDLYVGDEAQHKRGMLSITYPIENGVVQNWDALERIWEHTFYNELRVDPHEHPVMLTEAPMNPKSNRKKMLEIMMEKFQTPYVYVAPQPVLALYASGRTSGHVVDIGDGVAFSVPIYEGHLIEKGVSRLNLAGKHITHYLQNILRERGIMLNTTAEQEIVRTMKENLCYVVPDVDNAPLREVPYILPDGQEVVIGNELYRAPEILFNPSLVGMENAGLPNLVYNSVMQTQVDMRRTLIGNIVLCGGTSMIKGLPERLYSEIQSMTPGGVTVKVIADTNRNTMVWTGASVLCTKMPEDNWISRADYEEFGSEIIERKCIYV